MHSIYLLLQLTKSFIIPNVLPGSCSSPPADNNYLPVVFEPNVAVLLTCNKNVGNYVEKAGAEGGSSEILFANFVCDGGKWVNQDIYYTSKALRCTKGCPYVPQNDLMHVRATPEMCELLNGEGDDDKPPAYFKCEITCESGYYPIGNAENQLSSQTIYCQNKLGQAYWEVNTGANTLPFVKCAAGCFAYGSFKNEDFYGIIGNFKSVGEIDGVQRYISGEIKCDELNGFFAMAPEETDSVTLSCENNRWEPIYPDYYCIKGCRRPGGSFGQPAIPGYVFACVDGESGWYATCIFSCNGEAGYTMVGRSGRLPNGPMSEEIACTGGRFVMEKTANTCEEMCYPPTKVCGSGHSCTGVVYSHEGRDTGKRYCVEVDGTVGTAQLMRERFRSAASAMMMDLFGSYDWLT